MVAYKDLDAPKGRIVIRAEDFSSWLVDGLKWNWGLTASFQDKPTVKLTSSNGISSTSLLSNSKLDLSEIQNEKEKGQFRNFSTLFNSFFINIDNHIMRLGMNVEFTANTSLTFTLFSENDS